MGDRRGGQDSMFFGVFKEKSMFLPVNLENFALSWKKSADADDFLPFHINYVSVQKCIENQTYLHKLVFG